MIVNNEQPNFVTQLYLVEQNALDYIKSVLNKRGTGYELIDPATYEDGMEDEVYELPRANYVGKHGDYDEYAIIVVNIEADIISFECIPITETDDDRTFSSDEVSGAVICMIADLIYSLEN